MIAAGFKHGSERSKTLFALSIATGAFFVAVQGYEWVQLISYGMTMTSGVFGATFYLIVGCHALHAVAALIAMIWYYFKYTKGQFGKDGLLALQIYWVFVVLLWPILYRLIYF